MLGLLGLLVFGQVVELPESVQGETGVFVTVKPIRLEGAIVRYHLLDPGLSVLTDRTSLVAVGSKTGKYRVLAYTAKGDIPSPPAFSIIVLGGNPVPPGPNPVPPQPPPNPDEIKADPLYQALLPILGGLQEQGQRESLQRLAKVFADAASSVSSFAELAQVNSKLRDLSTQAGMGNRIQAIRARLADEIRDELGGDPLAKLEGGLGTKTEKLFRRFSRILEALSGEATQ